MNLDNEEHPIWIEFLPAQEGDERLLVSLEAAGGMMGSLKMAISDIRVQDKPTEFIRVGS